MQGIVKKDRYEAWLAYNVPIWRLILYSWKCATTKCMDPIHVVDVMDPVLVTMNCMLVRKLRGMYHIIRKFPSTPNGWVGTRNRSWTLQKVFQSAEKRLPPSHHPVIDCTDSYWTNLAGLERFTLLNCFFCFLCVLSTKNPVNSCLPSPPKRFSKSTRLSGTSGTTKLARRAGANAGVNVRKLPWAPKDLNLQVENTEKKHKYLRIFLRWLGCNIFPIW